MDRNIIDSAQDSDTSCRLWVKDLSHLSLALPVSLFKRIYKRRRGSENTAAPMVMVS
jgi:hypothetical protein